MSNIKLGLDYTVKFNSNALVRDLELFNRIFGSTVIKEATSKIFSFAQQEIAGYYEEYDPNYYNRTDQMRNHSFQQFKIKRGDTYFEGGIIFRPAFTNHENAGITEEQIYETVWDKGWHGRGTFYTRNSEGRNERNNGYIEGEPERFSKIEKMVGSSQFQSALYDLGMEAAMKKSYSILKFR